MNNCLNACTVGFGAPGKWTYVFGDVLPDGDIANLIALADVHAASETARFPGASAPEALKRKTVSRTPPMHSASEAA